jgi:hypothetical protein
MAIRGDNAMTNDRYQILGTDGDYQGCDRCGKTDLKKTIVIQDTETGNIVRYGVDCAGALLTGKAKSRKRGEAATTHADRISAVRAALDAGQRPFDAAMSVYGGDFLKSKGCIEVRTTTNHASLVSHIAV